MPGDARNFSAVTEQPCILLGTLGIAKCEKFLESPEAYLSLAEGFLTDSLGIPRDFSLTPRHSLGIPRDSLGIPRDSFGLPRDPYSLGIPIKEGNPRDSKQGTLTLPG